MDPDLRHGARSASDSMADVRHLKWIVSAVPEADRCQFEFRPAPNQNQDPSLQRHSHPEARHLPHQLPDRHL